MKGLQLSFAFILLVASGCRNSAKLHVVTVAEFEQFVSETGYITDAEKAGWSFVQVNVYRYETREHINWRTPDGTDAARSDAPVTQVSFNDAVAYCKWAGTKLPDYKTYWQLAQKDQRDIHTRAPKINAAGNSNTVGNVWDITTSENSEKEIRLAGGSYLCNVTSCNGTDPARVVFVDKQTANSNIGFAVIER